jgi:hypothetical protein
MPAAESELRRRLTQKGQQLTVSFENESLRLTQAEKVSKLALDEKWEKVRSATRTWNDD